MATYQYPAQKTYYRRVIRISAEDSPNVRLALAQRRSGITPTNEILLSGVLTWEEYLERREKWDKIKQCIGLDGSFYEGEEVLLYPPMWLDRAERIANERKRWGLRKARAIGIDPAAGGDKTAMAAVDDYGLLELVSRRTPNTADIPKEALAFIQKHGVRPEMVIFDAGGGGKQHADHLRDKGHNVGMIAFGAAVVGEQRRSRASMKQRREIKESKYTYKNRRAQLYGELRLLLDPINEKGFGLPPEYTELRRQLAPIPVIWNDEGQLELPPKDKKDKNSQKKTLIEIVGHSPDEADALVLAVHALLHRQPPPKASAR